MAVLAIVACLVKGTLAANSLSSSIASIAVNGGLLYEAYIIKKGNDTDTN